MKEKNIQNYASFSQRLNAFLIDTGIIITLVIFIAVLFFGFGEVFQGYISSRQDMVARQNFLIYRNYIRDVSFLVWVLYSVLMDSSGWHGTLGKKLMKIVVVDEVGKYLSIGMSVKRNLFKIISYIPLSLGFIWIYFDKKNQGWHDKFAKTFVIKI